jgi:hypothetical protein
MTLSGPYYKMTTSTWTLTSGGNWASSAGWNTKHVPVAGDTANLTAALLGRYDVDVTDSESASVVNIGNVNATLVVEGVSSPPTPSI